MRRIEKGGANNTESRNARARWAGARVEGNGTAAGGGHALMTVGVVHGPPSPSIASTPRLVRHAPRFHRSSNRGAPLNPPTPPPRTARSSKNGEKKAKLTLPEAILRAARQRLHVPHSARAGRSPPLRLLAPLDCHTSKDNLKRREQDGAQRMRKTKPHIHG